MKKLLVVLGVVLFASFFFTSCGGKKAEDIKVEELKEACDFADAQLIVMKEMKEIADANKDVKDLKDLKKEDQDKVEVLMKKLMEISEAQAKAEIKDEDIKKCDSYKEMEEIGEEMEKE